MDLQKLFNHMAENYDLILLDTEMFEIIDIVKEIISDAQAESPTVGDNEDKKENFRCSCGSNVRQGTSNYCPKCGGRIAY